MRKIILVLMLIILLVACTPQPIPKVVEAPIPIEPIIIPEPEPKTTPALKALIIKKPIYEDNYETDELHWGHMPITYAFGNMDACRERQVFAMIDSFNRIQEETDNVVRFKQSPNNPDFTILCVQGEGMINNVETLGSAYCETAPNTKLITKAVINIYGQGMVCGTGYPHVEVHEILHNFGFVHNALMDSIMRPYTAATSRDCVTTKIDDQYIDCLKNIYANGEYNCSLISKVVSKGDPLPCQFEGECPENTYPVKGTSSCCPNPNMITYEKYCLYPCKENEVRGADLECHQACGKDTYCPSNSICKNSTCLSSNQ